MRKKTWKKQEQGVRCVLAPGSVENCKERRYKEERRGEEGEAIMKRVKIL